MGECKVPAFAVIRPHFVSLVFLVLMCWLSLLPPAANSAAFAALDESKVDVKDLFMYRSAASHVSSPLTMSNGGSTDVRFLTQRGKGTVKRNRKRKKKSEDDEYSGECDEEEEEDGESGGEESFADMDFAGYKSDLARGRLYDYRRCVQRAAEGGEREQGPEEEKEERS